MSELARSELVGRHTRIADSSNPQIVGIDGQIIDETKSTFIIESQGARRMIPKPGSVFEFATGGSRELLDGSLICKRPYDRLRMKI